MKSVFKKVAVAVLAFFVIGIAGMLTYVSLALPNVGPPPDIKVELTEARIKRGSYLANHVAVCMDCHSKRDWNKFAGPLDANFFGAGGEVFDENMGFPGKFYSKNLTPHNLASWTDGEIFRAITSGVTKNGKAIFPVMPHNAYGKCDQEDIYSIIAYLRTLPSIKNEVTQSQANFPMNFILNTIPQKPAFQKIPDSKNQLLYGKYLFTMAACTECHTPSEKGKPIEGKYLAGGFEFKLPTGTVVSPNITPDVKTGIGSWSEEAFLNRFKVFADSAYVSKTLSKGDFQTVMPWLMYAKMTDEDLKAIFAYLKSVPAISNKVDKFKPNNN